MNLEDYITLNPFSLNKDEKRGFFFALFKELHQYHLSSSEEYRKISEVYFHKKKKLTSIEEAPFLPISVFKNKLLSSVSPDKVYKILKSSGTTSSVPSQIVLDKETAALQTLTLSKILGHILGKNRLPMLIVDSKSILKNRKSFTARGAGILGLSVFGKKHLYLLDDHFQLLKSRLKAFVEENKNERILIFGFTFLIWQYLASEDLDFEIDLSNAILIHSGGWKKLQSIAVDNFKFKKILQDKFRIKPENIYNFYGTVEQVGSIFLENTDGYLHTPNFSEVIIRDPKDFSVQKKGEEGLIQLVSILPKSYPGHSILTEDIGVITGEDDASNQWKGRYFKILRRAKKADIRGCSDTFET